jgi:biopolymer transport protein ExbD
VTRSRRKRDKPLEVVLPITPMLDMTFQLFFFFVITFNPSKMEGQMMMNLPAAGDAQAKDASDIDPSVIPDALIEPANILVVVQATAGGGIDKIFIRDASSGTPPIECRNDREKLKEELQKLKPPSAGDAKAKGSIKIETEGRLKYAALVEVMDSCIAAGFQQVGFAPPVDSN